MKTADDFDRPKKPAVLYIVPSAGIGGAETFIKHIAKFSTRSVPVFALLRDGELATWLQKNQSNFDYIFKIATPHPRTSRPLSLIKTARWLTEYADQNHCQLIHSSMAYSVPFGAYAARQLNIKHTWFQHGPVSGWRDRLAGALQTDLLICNSEFTLKMQKKISRTQGWNENEVLTLGVDLEAFRPQEATNELIKTPTKTITNVSTADNSETKAPLRLAMLCRPQRWKGLHIFAEALKQLNTPYEAFFIGANPEEHLNDYEKELLNFIEHHQLNFHFVEKLDSPAQTLSSMDLLINASTTPEPFGLSTIEAMAVGVVPILPDQGGAAEIAKDLGLHYSFADPKSLAERIIRVSQPSHLDELKKKVIKIANSRYDASNCIQRLEELHESFIEPA